MAANLLCNLGWLLTLISYNAYKSRFNCSPFRKQIHLKASKKFVLSFHLHLQHHFSLCDTARSFIITNILKSLNWVASSSSGNSRLRFKLIKKFKIKTTWAPLTNSAIDILTAWAHIHQNDARKCPGKWRPTSQSLCRISKTISGNALFSLLLTFEVFS